MIENCLYIVCGLASKDLNDVFKTIHTQCVDLQSSDLNHFFKTVLQGDCRRFIPPGTDHICKSPGNRRFVGIHPRICDFSEFTRESVFMSFEDNNLLFSIYWWRFLDKRTHFLSYETIFIKIDKYVIKIWLFKYTYH